jgi:hypothetical protein
MTDEDATPSESERNLTKLLAKKDGDAMALAADLLTDNAKLREDKRKLSGQLSDAQAKIPGEDSRVLSKDEAAELDAYRALELKPDELKAKLSDYSTTRAELVKTNNRAALAKLGIKGVALHMRQFDGVELVTEGEDDKFKAKVKVGDDEQTWDAWVKAQGLESDLKDLIETTETRRVFSGPGSPGVVPQDRLKAYIDKHRGDQNAS